MKQNLLMSEQPPTTDKMCDATFMPNKAFLQ